MEVNYVQICYEGTQHPALKKHNLDTLLQKSCEMYAPIPNNNNNEYL